jgi:4-amino-4-deoxy-L-arabinose transferase-like glycosyltransferase
VARRDPQGLEVGVAWLTERRLLAAAVVAWLAVSLIALVLAPPLGHDEAAFALVARGDSPLGEWLYRSQGTVWLAKLGLAMGGAEWQMRLPNAILGAGVPIAVFAVGRAAFSERTGAWAAAVIAGAHPMALRGAELLSDLTAAACMLGGIAVLVGELEREDGPRWRILAAAPLFAAAFYFRYGSAPVIVFALALAGALWWRQVAARWLRVLAVCALLALLIVPHLLHSINVTGRALGILEVSAGMPRRAYIGEGLVTYVTENPFLYYGVLAAPVALAGLVGMVRVRRKAPWYLALLALAQLVSLGLQSHGQPRYVFFAVALLVVLGVEVIARADRPRVALALVAASWLGTAIYALWHFPAEARTRAPIVETAQRVHDDAVGRPCAAVAMLVPQLQWYSGCEIVGEPFQHGPLPAGDVHYVLMPPRWTVDVDAIARTNHAHATPVSPTVWRLDEVAP